ncbi:TRAP transporter large permease subunit [Glaciecola sp. XM2]|jgi:tripartite ATP-independent transporter DctM subunit|uniref:TRAP transporter large permease n=1 Tax=Glaciecola sp. XM2 TaxID=1914931 RepID=UPI001BDECDA8|nr:TRAP transporter large permease subunit [Glaciecola sp. XM2]MBT1451092.1 TRAP transporter large permease subunit [Glaciecola sp. XM2]
MEWLSLVLFAAVCLTLLIGYPVALTLAGVSLIFAGIGVAFGVFDANYLLTAPSRLFGIISNTTLIAVPLFVFMGVVLERSKIAEDLLVAMSAVLGRFKSGLGVSVILVGMLLAASTGIVGATVVTMGLLSLPTMLNRGYSPALATGTICATGTLGQIIPPSIALVLLGDVLSSAYQKAQLDMGIFSPDSVSVGDLFVGALVPGLILVLCYLAYMWAVSAFSPSQVPEHGQKNEHASLTTLLMALLPPLLLIVAVLGTILFGFATPTEAAGVGAVGALILAGIKRQLSKSNVNYVVRETTKVTCMIFLILIGASIFSLVFRGFGGERLLTDFFTSLPGGVFTAMLLVMFVIFLLGFILDFIEITFVVVPIVAPILLIMGVDPIWLGIMIAVNLQTSFLTPPFGFALFYLRGVASELVKTEHIYKGVIPFILIQISVLILMAIWPSIVTWLPHTIYG